MVGSRAATFVGVGSLVLLVVVALPLWKPLLLAAVLAGTLSTLHERLANAVAARRSLSAALVTIGVLIVLLVPTGVIGLLALKQALGLVAFVRRTMAHGGVAEVLAPLPHWLAPLVNEMLARWTSASRDLAPPDLDRWSQALVVAASAVGSGIHFVVMVALMLIALFFLLRDGAALIGWMEDASALGKGRVRSLLLELRGVSRSVLGAQLGSGIVQATVATVGYFLSGVPSPLLFGLLSLAATFIPVGGVSLLGAPLAGMLWLTGHPGWAVFLLALTTVGTGLIDNVVRPLLVRGATQLNGALVFFALLGGLLSFGPIGVVVGPLALALFLSVSGLQRGKGAKIGV